MLLKTTQSDRAHLPIDGLVIDAEKASGPPIAYTIFYYLERLRVLCELEGDVLAGKLVVDGLQEGKR